jgi:hypothetical protein
MAGGKKKKTAIKKPVRPIATTSLAPKVVLEEKPVSEDIPTDTSQAEAEARKEADDTRIPEKEEEWDENAMEEAHWRGVIEKIKPVVEKEVSKSMKVRKLIKKLPV